MMSFKRDQATRWMRKKAGRLMLISLVPQMPRTPKGSGIGIDRGLIDGGKARSSDRAHGERLKYEME